MVVGSRGDLVTLQFKRFFSPLIREGNLPGRLDHHDANRTGFKDFLDDRALGVAQRRRRVGIGRAY